MTLIVIKADDNHGITKEVCKACAASSIKDSSYCHECKGIRYIEYVRVPKSCTQEQPNCPVFYDPMCNGWECRRCGLSGPC
jgi:hypothetical protein